jgi:hypothetical protein
LYYSPLLNYSRCDLLTLNIMQLKCHFLFFSCVLHVFTPFFLKCWGATEQLTNYVGRYSCFTVHKIPEVLCGKWKPEIFGDKPLQVSRFRYGEKQEHPTRCNCIILVLFQDPYMFRVPALPIIRSTILQLAVIGVIYMRWIVKCIVASTLKVVRIGWWLQFGPTYENGSWWIKPNQEVDKIIKYKNI